MMSDTNMAFDPNNNGQLTLDTSALESHYQQHNTTVDQVNAVTAYNQQFSEGTVEHARSVVVPLIEKNETETGSVRFECGANFNVTHHFDKAGELLTSATSYRLVDSAEEKLLDVLKVK